MYVKQIRCVALEFQQRHECQRVFVVVMLATYQMPTTQTEKEQESMCVTRNSETCYIRCEMWFLLLETHKQTLFLIRLFLPITFERQNVQSLVSIHQICKTWLDLGHFFWWIMPKVLTAKFVRTLSWNIANIQFYRHHKIILLASVIFVRRAWLRRAMWGAFRLLCPLF